MHDLTEFQAEFIQISWINDRIVEQANNGDGDREKGEQLSNRSG